MFPGSFYVLPPVITGKYFCKIRYCKNATDMTIEQKQEIIAYLKGPRDYQEGCSLYARYGSNLRLKRVFVIDPTETSREMLMEELRKLSGLSESGFRTLPRRAASRGKRSEGETETRIPMKITFTEEASDARSADAAGRREAPEPVKKMIKFREQYPFLNSEDCPDVLKVLVSDMFASYYRYKEAHARLLEIPDEENEKAAEECRIIVENYLNNREIREELDYYNEHHEILGKASVFKEEEPEEDLAELSEIDLMMQLRSASANESKQRKIVKTSQAKGETNEKAEASLEKWSLRKQALKAEVERRKKK